jgi:hypothetical protein
MQASANVALTPNHSGRIGPRVGTYITCDAAIVVQVSVDVPVVVPALSAIVPGALNEHAGESTAPAGPVILELSVTVPANPPLPVAVTVVAAGDPGATLIEVGFALTLNEPPPPPPPETVMFCGVDLLGPKFPSPA